MHVYQHAQALRRGDWARMRAICTSREAARQTVVSQSCRSREQIEEPDAVRRAAGVGRALRRGRWATGDGSTSSTMATQAGRAAGCADAGDGGVMDLTCSLAMCCCEGSPWPQEDEERSRSGPLVRAGEKTSGRVGQTTAKHGQGSPAARLAKGGRCRIGGPEQTTPPSPMERCERCGAGRS